MSNSSKSQVCIPLWLSCALLLFLLAGVRTKIYAQQNEIIMLEIPAQYRKLSTEEIIKRLLIRPRLSKAQHVSTTDAALVSLAVCGGNGVYYYDSRGIGRAGVQYQVVTKVGNDLQYVRSGKSVVAHRQLIDIYYSQTLISDKCITFDNSTPLIKQVTNLVELNK
ncbi:hypothetical protein [Hymenobacter guriensis]|uniref:Uncharacterized protein n=1 Tax=Hymenobacter guriensis TaxID=2793065 RepID=A0ABS0KZ89_9BACT|nr:hypothetical protein [Hymenobacter guriensis]MBG8553175.1 hypothetical protein [Hymenobacter guriensis]